MADATLISKHGVGCWLADVKSTTPAYIYFYPHVLAGITHAEAEAMYGKKKQDGTLVDGDVLDFFQAIGASKNGVDLTAVVLEIDADATSPYKGHLRWKFTTAATVS